MASRKTRTDTDMQVQKLMQEYAKVTGFSPANDHPQRYLWTDAFAVCNYVGLYRLTTDRQFLDCALRLVREVHHTLGRYRGDDSRTGWISGCGEEEGERHPTWGGLRIGKPLPEREPDIAFDERGEWDRDGQYYHYLTKWMHALALVSRVTGEPVYLRWATELARAIHPRFVSLTPSGGRKRMFWKMRTDLSAPLVPFMGQHDPLDGFITYAVLQSTAERVFPAVSFPALDPLLTDIADICRETDLVTSDPLGLGCLLFDATRISGLITGNQTAYIRLLETVIEAVCRGMQEFARNGSLRYPALYRLAFRELGLAIGLAGVADINARIRENPELVTGHPVLLRQMNTLMGYVIVRESINRFWRDEANRQHPVWKEHQGINLVMLATSLSPRAFLDI